MIAGAATFLIGLGAVTGTIIVFVMMHGVGGY